MTTKADLRRQLRRTREKHRKPLPELIDGTPIARALDDAARSQQWLATELGVARQRVSHWTTGRHKIPRGQAERVCGVFLAAGFAAPSFAAAAS